MRYIILLILIILSNNVSEAAELQEKNSISKGNFLPPPITLNSAALKNPYYKYNKITKYDTYFNKYTKHYFSISMDYLYLKAQSIAESRLNPEAKSPVGAVGLMQIMPFTYQDIQKRNKQITGSIKDERWNIEAGIYYMSILWKSWKPKDTWIDHWDFCTSSYNAGQGNIIKAQTLAEKQKLNPNIWSSMIITLPNVTGHFSKETITYVSRIKEIRSCLYSK